MASKMRKNKDKKSMTVGNTVSDMARGGINLITPTEPASEVLNVEKLVWDRPLALLIQAHAPTLHQTMHSSWLTQQPRS